MRSLHLLLVLLAPRCLFAATVDAPLQLENRFFRLQYSSETRTFSAAAHPGGAPFLSDLRLMTEAASVRLDAVDHRTFGAGRVFQVDYTNGNSAQVIVFPDLPFFLVQSQLRNRENLARVVREVPAISARVNLAKPVDELRSFGTGGLLAIDKNPGSYAWQAVVDPVSRKGVVLGWITHDRGSGVLFTSIEGSQPRVSAELEYGRLQLNPGNAEALETLAIGVFDDARLGLEAWADAVAKVYSIKIKPVPVGYCTWYSQPHGGASDEQHLAELSEFSATNLAPYGFSVVQIDDKWQDGVSTNGPKRNFTTHRPNGPYPGGMKKSVDHIKSLGLVPGIWFMPFAGTYYDPFFAPHQDWFIRTEDGRPYETAWGGTCLDMTHPGARAHLRDVVNRIGNEWGFQYFKLDGLWTGTGTRQQYVNSGYKDDQMGDSVLHDPEKTHIQAYREGLKLVRDTAGQDVFILGCNGPQNMRSYGGAFGLLDGMRIGPDNGASWKSLLRGPLFGSRHYFLHGRIWLNDPDPVYVRASMPLHHAQLICSWVGVSGQMNLSSEWLPGLPPERIEILQRTMPAHSLRPRPVDLFEREIPSLWLLTDISTPSRHVIAVYNWENQPQSFDYPLDRLGLDGQTDYATFEFWSNTSLPILQSRLQVTVPAESCRILAVRPVSRHPQVISTSRHVTQGIVDLAGETYNEATRTLSGRSRVGVGQGYELRVLAREDPQTVAVSAADSSAGVKITRRSRNGECLRILIESPVTREVSWQARF